MPYLGTVSRTIAELAPCVVLFPFFMTDFIAHKYLHENKGEPLCSLNKISILRKALFIIKDGLCRGAPNNSNSFVAPCPA